MVGHPVAHGNGFGIPAAQFQAWEQRQRKLAATSAEKSAALTARAAVRANSTPVVTTPHTFSFLRGLADASFSPVSIAERLGLSGGPVKKTAEEFKADPTSPAEKIGKTISDAVSGLGDVGKWLVVGLVAVAFIVVVPRLLPK